MKKMLFCTSMLVLSSVGIAGDDTGNKKAKSYDMEKYCYYADAEYSHGAIMEQAGSLMKCVRIETSKNLVWRELKEGEL